MTRSSSTAVDREPLHPPVQEASGGPAATAPAADRILSAAFSAFVEEGYTGASTLRIATRAKVSKRELYALFGNKLGILRACIALRAQRMQPPEPPPTPRDPKELEATLTAFGTRLLEEITHPSVVAVHSLAVAESARAPEIGRELDQVRRQVHASVVEWLARAQAAGLLRPGDPQALATDFLGLLMGDLMVRLMQRVAERPTARQARRAAGRTAAAFVRIHGSA
ncbi:MAG: TetR/AcrR family transcriptional regulator [Phenylobacterium sp.]|nr:TetR/AcrR family transcriptional regulator [Phenylobacterium sp.]